MCINWIDLNIHKHTHTPPNFHPQVPPSSLLKNCNTFLAHGNTFHCSQGGIKECMSKSVNHCTIFTRTTSSYSTHTLSPLFLCLTPLNASLANRGRESYNNKRANSAFILYKTKTSIGGRHPDNARHWGREVWSLLFPAFCV